MRTSRRTLHLLEVSLRLCSGACYGDSVAVSSGGTGCPLRGWWVIAYSRSDHLCNNWMILFVLHDPGDCLDESIGSFHQRFSLCEWPIKNDGNEHLSVFFDEGWSARLYLLQDCYCFVSQRFRFHSSIALCAGDPVSLSPPTVVARRTLALVPYNVYSTLRCKTIGCLAIDLDQVSL